MDTQNRIYQRTYSELAGLQTAYTMEYGLRTAEPSELSVFRREPNGAKRGFRVPLPGETPETAQYLLTFLYENAVSLENAPGVLADYLPARER